MCNVSQCLGISLEGLPSQSSNLLTSTSKSSSKTSPSLQANTFLRSRPSSAHLYSLATTTTKTTMKFPFLALLLPTLTTAVTISYDPGYDDPSRPLTSVACSDVRPPMPEPQTPTPPLNPRH